VAETFFSKHGNRKAAWGALRSIPNILHDLPVAHKNRGEFG
jgi:hypothetical protein